MSPRAVFFAPTELVGADAAAAAGRVSAETVCAYPPGIPALVPGEPVRADALAALRARRDGGATLTGCTDPTLARLVVVAPRADDAPAPKLTLDEYAARALESVVRPEIPRAALGLVGEAGDVADSVTEVLRARDGCCDADAKAQIARELGDVMWHTAAIAEALGYSLEDIARMNLEQLGERSASGAIRDGGAQRWR